MGSLLEHACSFFMIVNVLLLCQIPCVECASIPSTTKSTYNTSDGKICDKCSPGQYLMQDCINSGEGAKCGPCALGTFQSVENIAKNCTSCTQCGVYKILIEPCDATTDNICQCPNGSFSVTVGGIDICRKHSTCPPGEGVKQKGNTNKDTVCEPCAEGTFSSNDSATETCKPCTRCEVGYIDTASCTQKNDTTCGKPTEPSAVQQSLIPNVPIIVVSCVLGVGVLIGILYWWCRRRGRRRNGDPPNSPSEQTPLNENGAASPRAESSDSDSAAVHAQPVEEQLELRPMLLQQNAQPVEEQLELGPMLVQQNASTSAATTMTSLSSYTQTTQPATTSTSMMPATSSPTTSSFIVTSPTTTEDISTTGETVLKDHFDVCIVYSQADEDNVYKFKDHLEKIDLKEGQHPKISLYTDEIWAPAGLARKAEFICKHCTLIFVYLSKNFNSDDYAYFFKNQTVIITIKNSRTRPILSEQDCDIPTALVNAQKINWYNRDKRAYKENIERIFEINIPERLKREAERIKSDLSP